MLCGIFFCISYLYIYVYVFSITKSVNAFGAANLFERGEKKLHTYTIIHTFGINRTIPEEYREDDEVVKPNGL